MADRTRFAIRVVLAALLYSTMIPTAVAALAAYDGTYPPDLVDPPGSNTSWQVYDNLVGENILLWDPCLGATTFLDNATNGRVTVWSPLAGSPIHDQEWTYEFSVSVEAAVGSNQWGGIMPPFDIGVRDEGAPGRVIMLGFFAHGIEFVDNTTLAGTGIAASSFDYLGTGVHHYRVSKARNADGVFEVTFLIDGELQLGPIPYAHFPLATGTQQGFGYFSLTPGTSRVAVDELRLCAGPHSCGVPRSDDSCGDLPASHRVCFSGPATAVTAVPQNSSGCPDQLPVEISACFGVLPINYLLSDVNWASQATDHGLYAVTGVQLDADGCARGVSADAPASTIAALQASGMLLGIVDGEHAEFLEPDTIAAAFGAAPGFDGPVTVAATMQADVPSELVTSGALSDFDPGLADTRSMTIIVREPGTGLVQWAAQADITAVEHRATSRPVVAPVLAGFDVRVEPALWDPIRDRVMEDLGMDLRMAEVVDHGELTVQVDPPGPETSYAPPDSRFAVLDGTALLMDIESTAVLGDGSTVEVCIDYSAVSLVGSAEDLTLQHEVDGVWVNITTSNDVDARRICGVTESFSYFALLEPLTVLGATEPAAVGSPVTLAVDAGDPPLATAVHWDWGDGTTETVVVTAPEVVAEHAYDTAGVYTVTATLLQGSAEASVEVGSAEFRYAVVYDPAAGFVTGGGWIDSPPGAYAADATLTGKANFGFVSRYRSGASIPSGNTEFRFRAGNLRFKSTAYDWLVIAGARAQFKGVGTINGAGDFGFLLTAIDASLTPSTDVDLFRLKLWDRSDGDRVVYDNGLGAGDDADPPTALGGGSIVIHRAR